MSRFGLDPMSEKSTKLPLVDDIFTIRALIPLYETRLPRLLCLGACFAVFGDFPNREQIYKYKSPALARRFGRDLSPFLLVESSWTLHPRTNLRITTEHAL